MLLPDTESDGVASATPLRTVAHDIWRAFDGTPVFARSLADIRTYAQETDIEGRLRDINWVDSRFHQNALVSPRDPDQIAWFDGIEWHLSVRLRIANGFEPGAIPILGTVSRRIVLPPVLLIPLDIDGVMCPWRQERCKRIIPPPSSPAIIWNICGRKVEFRIGRSRSSRRVQLYAEANLCGPRHNLDGSPRSMLYLGDHRLTLPRRVSTKQFVGQVLVELVDWIHAQRSHVDPTMERSDLLRLGELISLPNAKDVAAAVNLGSSGSLVSCALPPYGYPVRSMLDAHERLGELERRMR
jgi:hypothetical protein